MASEDDVKNAISLILKHINPNCNDEVLKNTPSRVLKSFDELFCGYKADINKEIGKSFENSFGYKDIVLIDNIKFSSTCEHHFLPIRGVVHVAYIPNERIIGLSKICRIVEIFSRRLQLQERLTNEIGNALNDIISPLGVAIMISAEHDCMCSRGVKKIGSSAKTFFYNGIFNHDNNLKQRFFDVIT